jgi:hypothetical protein
VSETRNLTHYNLFFEPLNAHCLTMLAVAEHRQSVACYQPAANFSARQLLRGLSGNCRGSERYAACTGERLPELGLVDTSLFRRLPSVSSVLGSRQGKLSGEWPCFLSGLLQQTATCLNELQLSWYQCEPRTCRSLCELRAPSRTCVHSVARATCCQALTSRSTSQRLPAHQQQTQQRSSASRPARFSRARPTSAVSLALAQ